MHNTQNTDVVIIGAGLTGLTLAFYLKKHGISFKILEKNNRAGGVIHTHTENGFIYETGPNTGVISHPEVIELFENLNGSCESEIANLAAKKRLIWKNGKWHALPSGPVSAIFTPLFSFYDKLRALGEPFRKKGTNSMETIAGMVKRRLGKSFLNYAIDPFIAGVYAGDTEKLVLKYALPKMYNLEYTYGSLIKGGIKKSKENKKDPRMAKATREVFSAKNGLSCLINALEKNVLPENIIVSSKNTQVKQHNDTYIVLFNLNSVQNQIQCKYVVTTSGAYTLPDILPFLTKEKLEPIISLEYAKVVLVILGYNEWNGISLDAFGGLIPSKEKKNILGILFTSSFFENRAPEGGALLSVFVGGTSLPSVVGLSDEELEELVLANVKNMLGTNLQPNLFKIFRYEHAIPQYEASTKERLEAIEQIQKENPGLLLAGSIRDGIGMADRIKQGRAIAEEISKLKWKKVKKNL